MLLNALVHRDYTTGAPIQIRVYEDQIRFGNDGQLPEGWTVKQLLEKHRSQPHNPLIAGAFFRTGDIESWGRGIDKIRDACRENETEFPAFDIDQTGMMVEFKGVVPELPASNQGDSQPISSPESSPKGSPKTENRILQLIREDGSISTERIGEILGISKRAVLKRTRKLQDQNRLKRIGPAKGGHWQVQDPDTGEDDV